MGLTFNIEEILKMAEQIERNGDKFYRKAAENVSDDKVRKMLLKLAEMEVEHEKTFAAMRVELSDSEKQSDIFDPDNEAGLYLQAMAGGHVFNIKQDASEKLTGKESVAEILNMALQAERDSIAFYAGLQKYAPSQAGKNKVEHIIAEEMAHIVTLSGELAKAK